MPDDVSPLINNLITGVTNIILVVKDQGKICGFCGIIKGFHPELILGEYVYLEGEDLLFDTVDPYVPCSNFTE